MSDRAPYSRVYWSIVDDPKFLGIYDNNDHLATWLRLLIAADALWPASCPIPGNARKASVAALVEAGLIDLGTGYRFRVHGLDAERGRRRDAARTGTKRHPDGTQTGPERDLRPGPKTSRDEPRLDKLSRDDARVDPPWIEAWLMVKHRVPTEAQQGFLDRYLQVFDDTGPHRMAQLILENPADPIAALKADLDAFREQRLGELSNGHVSTPRPKPKPKLEPWQEEHRAAVEAQNARFRRPIAEESA